MKKLIAMFALIHCLTAFSNGPNQCAEISPTPDVLDEGAFSTFANVTSYLAQNASSTPCTPRPVGSISANAATVRAIRQTMREVTPNICRCVHSNWFQLMGKCLDEYRVAVGRARGVCYYYDDPDFYEAIRCSQNPRNLEYHLDDNGESILKIMVDINSHETGRYLSFLTNRRENFNGRSQLPSDYLYDSMLNRFIDLMTTDVGAPRAQVDQRLEYLRSLTPNEEASAQFYREMFGEHHDAIMARLSDAEKSTLREMYEKYWLLEQTANFYANTSDVMIQRTNEIRKYNDMSREYRQGVLLYESFLRSTFFHRGNMLGRP